MQSIEKKIRAEAERRAKRQLKSFLQILSSVSRNFGVSRDFKAIEARVNGKDLAGCTISFNLQSMFDDLVCGYEDAIIASIDG